MRLGLVADIHEHVENLRAALEYFTATGVDQIVGLGDLVADATRLEETCALLAARGVIGVWGNHDFGLCVDPDPEFRERYSARLLDYMATLRPRLAIEDCLFTHVEPWLDPEDMLQLWYFDGPPREPAQRDQIFQATPYRVMFAGHYHRWLHVTPERIEPWAGDQPLDLRTGRHYLVLGAVCDGYCAVYDTSLSYLTPHNLERTLTSPSDDPACDS